MDEKSSSSGVKRSAPCDSNEANEAMLETQSGDSHPQPAPKKLKTSESSTTIVLSYRRNVKITSAQELVNDHARENRINTLQMEEEEFIEITTEIPEK
ncbi:sperm protein associated with the nucleus on the X chromosome C-like [Pan paniscus]|uniref:sperm protein associated with the nucleus on the X chromosome C-like n=1 Tax=Pan paniscus TaxID=9597 RepID=UPI0024368E3F|nr:sperm protein associated with the nucleus on the X chromosome C-like [Pan paniscus]